jgi:TPR repeat protein
LATSATNTPAPCLAPGDSPDPFVVDWPADRRGDLEVALKRGIVVLSLSCTSTRVLPDCSAEGAYSFIGTTEREELVSLRNADEVKANLPLLAPALTGPSGVDFQHGASVDVAIATIGQRASSRSLVSRADLKGDCRDATHFVRIATLGAFAMGPGAPGQSKAVADVFARGTSGGAQMAKDGSLQACRGAAPDAETAAAQCGAPVSLQLKAIHDESVVTPVGVAKTAPVAAPTCPPGMARGETGACETISPERSHVCAPADIADCAQQCDHGSATSCSILGRSYQLGRGVPLDLARASELLTKACTAGATVACGRLGEMALNAHDEQKGLRLLGEACSAGWADGCRIAANYAVKHATPGIDVVALYRRGCRGGDPESCWSLGAFFSDGVGRPKNEVEAARWLALACEGGAKLGCTQYAQVLDAGRGVPADPARAVALLATECDGGQPTACAGLGEYYVNGHSVPRDVMKGLGLLERGCKLGDAQTCFKAGTRRQDAKGVPRDVALERLLFTNACNGGLTLACAKVPKP